MSLVFLASTSLEIPVADPSVGVLPNIAPGERGRWLPRRQASTLALPGNDFWLIDDRVLFSHLSGIGEWLGVELVTDPAVLKFCAESFEAVWNLAIDHADYRPM